MPLRATVDDAITQKEKMRASNLASAVKELAFNILEAPSRSLLSEAGSSSSILLSQMTDVLETTNAVAQALIAIAVAS